MTSRRTAIKHVRRVTRGVRRRVGSLILPPELVPQSSLRLVRSPVFVLSPVRSGSTLLRVILNSHSQIRAPHEMHLRHVHVTVADRPYVADAIAALNLNVEEMENLLWDRIMHRELQLSRKRIFVDKTPQNVHIWKRLHRTWPEARYIFLLRHPASVVDSLMRARKSSDPEADEQRILVFARHLDDARTALPGHTVRYEELAADPGRVTQDLCAFLGVPWERGMLNYGEHDHGKFKARIGDWSKNIRSGQVNPPRPLPAPDEVPEPLREQSRAWGYL